MLQQTQTDRVLPKYLKFISHFPTIHTLAEAPFQDVLAYWHGLGYNRRALFLHRTARILSDDFNSIIPTDPNQLQELPGIGPYTAHAVSTFAFNNPHVFIETNIRSVFLYTFFYKRFHIPDSYILPLISQTLDRSVPRQWYWALMDYGSSIKKLYGNPNKRSRHYTKQKPFEGSDRQARGRILRTLTAKGKTKRTDIAKSLHIPAIRYEKIIADLELEGFIVCEGEILTLSHGTPKT